MNYIQKYKEENKEKELVLFDSKIIYLWQNVTNSQVELPLKNRHAKRGCPKNYNHIVKFILNLYGTLRS